MGGRQNLDRTPNLDGGTLTLDGGMRPPCNLSTGLHKRYEMFPSVVVIRVSKNAQ